MNPEKWNGLERIIEKDYGNIAGLVVQKDGKRLYENYFHGYAADDAVHVYSVTKSVLSALMGIAIDQGYIKSLDQIALDFFPDYTVQPGETTIKKITIRHLMTMTAPYKYEVEPYMQFFASDHPIRDALDLLGGDGPIGQFNYTAVGGVQILSGILRRAIGRPILDFARDNLFLPMGIDIPRSLTLASEEEHLSVMNDRAAKGWVTDPQGNNTAGWGLFLTPVDMAKIGQLYLERGMWMEKRIVSAEWVKESVREHSRFGRMAYGYLWWIIDGNDSAYAAMGDGGNVIYVNEKKGLVVSIASLFMPEARDRIELLKTVIEPMAEGC